MMEDVACNLCGSNRHETLYHMPDTHYPADQLFRVVRCEDCGLGFVNPRPKAEDMAAFYPEAFYADFDTSIDHHDNRYRIQAQYLAGVKGRLENPRLLDVGCATGNFPRMMQKQGWTVEGLEVSDIAERIQDFTVHRCPLPELSLPDGQFDAITAWAVLEHVHDPKAYMEAVGRLLKPGGKFVFLVTNLDSLSSRALFREDVPRHLYFFSHKTVSRYLAESGLRLRSYDNNAQLFEMQPVNWLHYAFCRLKGGQWAWNGLPETRHEYFKRAGLKVNFAGNLRFALTHPLSALDRLLMPLYIRWQYLRRTYGITTYVCDKP
jgi:2-polyprenyl-3-methyl-5-hydroxy-6-metoxy-1,4-benzoquinol methylase